MATERLPLKIPIAMCERLFMSLAYIAILLKPLLEKYKPTDCAKYHYSACMVYIC